MPLLSEGQAGEFCHSNNALPSTRLCNIFWTVNVLPENAVVIVTTFRFSFLLFFQSVMPFFFSLH
jgi:hypothetical protein